MDTPLLGEVNKTRLSRKFLLLLALYAIPLAATQITIYDLLFDVVCKHDSIAHDQCNGNPDVARKVTSMLSFVSLMSGIVATIIAVGLSAYTDKAGRKFGLVWFMGLTTVGTAAYPLVAYGVPSHWTYWRMIVPYFFVALGGSPSIMLNLSVLYITDLLPDPRLRTEYLSFLIGMSMSVQAIAPGVGGTLLKAGVHMAVYLVGCATFMAISTAIFAWFVKSDRRSEEDCQQSGGLSIKRAGTLISFSSCGTPILRRNACIVFVNFIMSNMFAVGFVDLIMVFAKHKFSWTGSEIGTNLFKLFSVRTFWAVLGFPVLYSQLTRYWPAQSETVDRADLVHMYLCNLLTIAGYLTLGFAETSNQYSHGLTVLANDGIAGPIWINALLKHVDASHKGEFMAALNFIVKPVEALLPALMMKFLTATLDSWPELVFFVVAVLTILLLVSQFFIKSQF